MVSPRSRVIGFSAGLLSALLGVGVLVAADKEAAGKAVTPTGLVVQRDATGKKWQVVKEGDPVLAGQLVVGLPGAGIDSPNGAVRLSLLADLDGRSNFPILESAVEPLAPEKADLTFVLDRGRVELVNRKAKGAAEVVIRFRKETWHLSLEEPGTRVVLEMYGRWPRGVYFHPGAKAPEEPATMVVVVVLKGEADLKTTSHEFQMKAPPGPALFTWDSVSGDESGPKKLDKLPEWADPDAKPTPEGTDRKARVEKARQKLAAAAPETVVDELIAAEDPLTRRGGLILAGAFDLVPKLIDALADPKRADVRENAIMVLRHWIGRSAGQDQKLFEALQVDKKYTPIQAEIVLQGLHSPGEADLGRPETYESLINYLSHPKVAIRELAKYHLYRTVSGAKDIPFDPAGPEADREAAIKKWKVLIPDGKLPPKPEPKKDK
jgi:hypothetical protein